MKNKILIVEQSKDVSMMLEKIFRKYSFETVSCSSALEGLKVLKRLRIDLIISDVELVYSLIKEIKENIALSVPHELRTPLFPILGYSEMLLELANKYNIEEIKQYSQSILKSTLRLKNTIEKFIVYSGLHYELNAVADLNCTEKITKADITAMVRSLIQKVSTQLSWQSISDRMDINIEEGTLQIDGNFLEICIKEIIENAIKFANGCPTITITGRISDDYYELGISNTGSYFSTDKVNNIGIFYKQSEPNKTGSGLGLPIVKKIMEFFGGNLLIENKTENLTIIKLLIKLAE